jgi:hypothetical protein
MAFPIVISYYRRGNLDYSGSIAPVQRFHDEIKLAIVKRLPGSVADFLKSLSQSLRR